MDVSDYFRFLIALVFVLSLIIAIALLARRAGFGFPSSALKSADNRRLSVIEVVPVDGRRRMVLVRRDNVEHLLLLGANTETVIEAGIPVNPNTVSFKETLEIGTPTSAGSENKGVS